MTLAQFNTAHRYFVHYINKDIFMSYLRRQSFEIRNKTIQDYCPMGYDAVSCGIWEPALKVKAAYCPQHLFPLSNYTVLVTEDRNHHAHYSDNLKSHAGL